MTRPSGVDVMVHVVRRVLSNDWAPSRAMAWRVVLRSVNDWDRSVDVVGRGFGSVAVR